MPAASPLQGTYLKFDVNTIAYGWSQQSIWYYLSAAFISEPITGSRSSQSNRRLFQCARQFCARIANSLSIQ